MNLDFELNHANEYVAQVGRYTVRIVRDNYAQNPWEDWDGEPPYMKDGEPATPDFPTIAETISGWTRNQCKVFARAIARELDINVMELWQDCLPGAAFLNPEYIAENLFEAGLDCARKSEQESIWVHAFEVAGWTYLSTSSHGYCQGDYADLLFVWTPATVERYGIPEDSALDQLEYARKLWGYWAWGDVYGFVIETPDGEHVDSCFGYYTDSPDTDEKSGLLDTIRESMPDDWQIDPDIGEAAIYAA